MKVPSCGDMGHPIPKEANPNCIPNDHTDSKHAKNNPCPLPRRFGLPGGQAKIAASGARMRRLVNLPKQLMPFYGSRTIKSDEERQISSKSP